MKVTKFGGSSLASATQLKKVLDIIKDALNNNDLGTLKEKFIMSTRRREKID